MRTPTNHLALTQRAVQKLSIPGKPGRRHYYDEDLTGFGVRVESSGRKSFFFFAKANGKPEFRALGEFPAVSVNEARDAAKGWAGELSNWRLRKFEGPSPFQKEKKEKSNVPTFQELVDAYVERKVKVDANRPESAERNVRWMVKKYFPDWTRKRIDRIGIEDVLTLRNAIGKKHPYMANRVVELAKAAFNWCAGNGEQGVNFWPVENPARNVKLYDETKRKRFLQPTELVAFNDALKNEQDADLRDFLTIAIASGARKSNILGMKWTDISFERTNWHIPLSKSGEAYDVTLRPAALKVLERRRTEVPDSEEFVFPSYSTSGHVVDMKKKWEKFRLRAGIPDVRVHDLRRTCGAYMAMSGASMKQIADALGHESLQSTEIYAPLHEQAVSHARQAGEAKMLEMEKAARRRMKITARKQKLLPAVARD